MGMVVRTNTMSANAYRQLGANNTQLSKSLEKLSSGYRINRAGDDSSGLAISEKMKAQIAGLDQASSNSQDGISLVQTAEGALTETHSMLNRMVTLAEKSANGTIQDDVDRDAIQTEVDALKSEITRVSQSTNFNGITLLDGTLSAKAAVTSTAGTDSTATAAVAAVYTVDVSSLASTDTGAIDGTAVTWNTDAATTMGNFVTSYNGTSSNKYTASYSGGTLTLTAKTAGAVASDPTATLTVGGAAATVTEATAGADATSGSAATSAVTTLDYTGKTGKTEIGSTVTVDGKTYEFINATGGKVSDSSHIAVSVNATDNATTLASSLASAITTNDTGLATTYTVASSGAKLTFTSVATGSTAAAETVTQAGGGLVLQVGDTNANYNKVSVSVGDMSAEGLGIANLDVSSQDAAGEAISTIKNAINTVSTNRGDLGAMQNRLEHAISNLDTTSENMSSANSAIRDTDMAKEMMNYTKMNILSQAAQAMLAQANQQPQNILQLLK